MKKPRTIEELTRMGGKARMKLMTKKERSAFGRTAALARHGKTKQNNGTTQDVQ
jgi:hypothetical protein